MKVKFTLVLLVVALLAGAGIATAQDNSFQLLDSGISLDLAGVWNSVTYDSGFVGLQSDTTYFDPYWYYPNYLQEHNVAAGDVAGTMGLLWADVIKNDAFKPDNVQSTVVNGVTVYTYDYTYTKADGNQYEDVFMGINVGDMILLADVYPRTGATLQGRDAALTLIASAQLAGGSASEVPVRLTILQNASAVKDALTQDIRARLYVFNANQGDIATVTMQPTKDSRLDTYLALLGPRGELIAVNDDVDYNAGDYSSLINAISIPETGSYFVIASSYQYITTLVNVTEDIPDNLGYELSVSGITPVESMGDGFIFYSTELAPSSPFNGQISTAEPAWYFTFLGSTNDVVNLTANGDFDTMLQVFAPEGARIAVNDDIDTAGGNYNSALNGVTLPADGKYFVIVTNPFIFQPSTDTDLQDPKLYGAFTAELTK